MSSEDVSWIIASKNFYNVGTSFGVLSLCLVPTPVKFVFNDGHPKPLVCFIKFNRTSSTDEKPVVRFEVMFADGSKDEQKQRFESYMDKITTDIIRESVNWLETVKRPDHMKTRVKTTRADCA